MPSSAISLYFARTITKSNDTAPICILILSLPIWVFAVIAAASLAASVVVYIRIRHVIKGELTPQSVCDGLDQLPDGVCYSMQDGFPRLVNDRMQQISNAAFGVGVLDAKKLREQQMKQELMPGCSVDERGGNTFLRLSDGSVWRMKKQTVTVDKRELDETIAYGVTQRYHDLIELEQRNKRLEEVNRQIREYDRSMDRIIREKEILAAKIRLHGNLGQCFLAIQEYLTGNEQNRDTVTKELINTVSLLRNNTVDEHTEDRLYALYEAAKAVGVEIRLQGEIPEEYKETVEVAIHECLTNTVKHAGGHVLDVVIRNEENCVKVELTNDGKPPTGKINETGGLKNLRALVEGQGGEMTVLGDPVFRLVLSFQK
ncbi:MAG: ATP-binding protein [Clostridia bacterium]|nr:ATP-binding protein [Clostridia bacterium]